MAERVGLINYRAVTSDMTTLNLDMQINTYMLAFINYIHILDYKRFEINLIHWIATHEQIVLYDCMNNDVGIKRGSCNAVLYLKFLEKEKRRIIHPLLGLRLILKKVCIFTSQQHKKLKGYIKKALYHIHS